MVLGDLSVNFNREAVPDKDQVEKQLSELLPKGSFMVLLRNYHAGDFRTNDENTHQAYKLVITLRREGRTIVLQKKDQFEAMGYTVSEHGEISLS